jgi:predicted RNA polymerase sigma factor
MLTATSCRTLAENDDVRAAAADLPTQRKRFQDSADAWNDRADMLERIGRLDAARRAPERTFDNG